MALTRYVVNKDVTLTPGTFTHDAVTGGAAGTGYPANFGTGSNSTGAGLWGSGAQTATGASAPVIVKKGMILTLDSAGAVFTAIGSANLTAYTDGTDAIGRSTLSN